MSVFLKMAGAAMMALGIGLAVVFFTSPGLLNARGIGLESAILLFIGGVLATGQSGVIDASKGRRTAGPNVSAPAAEVIAAPLVVAPVVNNAFGRKPDIVGMGTTAKAATVGVAAAAGAGLAAVAAKATSKDPVADTISALEQAKADVIKSIGGIDLTTAAPAAVHQVVAEPVHEVVHAAEPAALDEETADEPVLDEDGLYVVEEKVVRGRPARILSDDTVEAETDEGWMRFENMEHLNEYLDSVEEQAV